MSKKKAPCPYCGELILAKANKCRFCKEWIKKSKVDNRKKPILEFVISFAIWIVSMVLFLAITHLSNGDLSTKPVYYLFVMLGCVLIGGLVFTILLIKTITAIITKEMRVIGLISFLLIALLMALFFYILMNNAPKGNAIKTPPTPTPLVCSDGKIACYWDKQEGECLTDRECLKKRDLKNNTSTEAKTTVKTNTTTANSDPPVLCPVDPKCGGGTTPFKKSECAKSTCCLVNGSYKVTLNASECQDTIVKCNISPNCGGGIKEMRKIDCDNMTCCQINNTWELRNKGQCNTEQKAQATTEWYAFCDSLWSSRHTNLSDWDGYWSCVNSYKP
jgi:hypothetical protein